MFERFLALTVLSVAATAIVLLTGRLDAIWTALAACILFVLYLLFVNPLPSGDDTVPPMLAIWIGQLTALFLVALAVIRRRRSIIPLAGRPA